MCLVSNDPTFYPTLTLDGFMPASMRRASPSELLRCPSLSAIISSSRCDLGGTECRRDCVDMIGMSGFKVNPHRSPLIWAQPELVLVRLS